MTIQYIPGNMITVNASISNNDLSIEQQKNFTYYLYTCIYMTQKIEKHRLSNA